MTTSAVVVGVDVAKDRLDVAVRPSGEVWSEANDEAGITALVTRLRPLGPALIVFERSPQGERWRRSGLTDRASAAGRRVVVHEHNYCLTVGAVSCKRMLGGGISLAMRQIPSRRSDSAT